MPYTLKPFFQEAQVPVVPDWFGEIILRHRKIADFKPRWEQVEGLNMGFAYPNLRCALFDEQGTGKTLPAQAFAIWQGATGNKIVCLMPRTLLRQFEGNLYFTYEGIHKHLRCEIYHGLPKERDAQVARWSSFGAPDIVVTTPGVFMKEFELFRLFKYQSLLMDEAKYLANPDSKICTAVDIFMGVEGEKYAMVLNGTPAKNTLEDLYGNIKFLTPKIYHGPRHFQNKHIEYKKIAIKVRGMKSTRSDNKMRNIDVIEDYKNLDELVDNLYKQARRVEKSSLNLPPLTEDTVPFDLSEAHKAAYEEFVQQRLLEFNDGSILDGTTSAGLRLAAFQSIMRPEILGVNEESLLLELIEELMLDAGIEKGGMNPTKVFLMAHYQKTIELLAERFKRFEPAIIYGKTSNPTRQKERFMYDNDCRLLIINYQSIAGLDGIQDVSYTGICAEPTSVPGDYDQARDRLHRGGQINPVQIYLPKPRGTLYVKAIHDLQVKKGWIDRVVSVRDFKEELLGMHDEEEVELA